MCTAPSTVSATTNPTGSSWSSTAAQARPACRYPDRDSAGSGGLSATLLIPMSRNASPAASWIACSRPTSPGRTPRIDTAADRDAMAQKYDIDQGWVINSQLAWVHSPRAGPPSWLASAGAVCQGGRVDSSPPPRVVVVGGGIAGLAAAFFLREEPVSVTVLEGSPRLGGKLAVSPVAGIAVDEGAEALL